MKGSIYKRSKNSWTVVVDLPRGADDKRKQKSFTVQGTKKDAERELNRVLHEVNTGAYVEPSKLTVGAYLQQWLNDYAKTNVSAKTAERYEDIVRAHLAPALGAIPLSKLRPLHIQSHYSEALKSGRRDGAGGLSPQTVLHHHRLLRKALQDAMRLELIPKNPAAQVDPPRATREEMHVLSVEEVNRLIEATRGTVLHIPIILAITTGMRRGEIFGLRWQDVDLETGALAVRRSLEQTRSGLSFKEPKTALGRRVITLPSLAVNSLKEHKKQQDDDKALLGKAYQQNDLICAQRDGSPIAPNTASGRFARMVSKAGVPKIRFHDLRHTHATICLQQGLHPKVVQERLGHATVGITLDVYSHVIPSMQEEAARKLDGVFGG